MAGKSTIVFPTDFSELSQAALPWVRQMADALAAEVHCIYVVEEPQIYATLDMGPVPIPSAEELASTARTRLENFTREAARNLGTVPVAKVLVGRPSDEIVNYAKEQHAKLLVMPTHGYSGVKHMLLGSTTEAVLRHATCPVLSIRTG